MRNKQPSIRKRLSEATAQQIATNRQKLHSIVETVVLGGRQNIPLRGHWDSTMDVEHTLNVQHGNFWALLQFCVAAGDTVLRDHLAQSSRNATYTSSRIQNQILDILGSTVVRKIVQSQRCHLLHCNCRWSHWLFKEQLSLVLRYVKITRSEKTLFPLLNAIVASLADRILTFLSSHGLDPSKLHGQAYERYFNSDLQRLSTSAVSPLCFSQLKFGC